MKLKLPNMRSVLMVALLVGATMGRAQQPFELDPSFRTEIDHIYVNSVLQMDDGKLLVSGDMAFQNGDIRYITRLNTDGSRDGAYPTVWAGGAKLVSHGSMYYVMDGGTFGNIRRLNSSGVVDPSFQPLYNNGTLFSLFQGGDYHVYPDGSVVITGSHTVNVPDSGWTGSHHMIWFNNDGTLDLTRRPRKGNGAIYLIVPQPDGKFLLSGASTTWEGQPVPNTFRVHADGTLDPSFIPGISWGECQGITVLDDGRLLATGLFKTTFSSPDTLHCVRLFPDGTMDPTFNNGLIIRSQQFGQFLFLRHTYIPGVGIALHGNFDDVDGHERNGFILLDENGHVPADPLGGVGCGPFEDFVGLVRKGTMGMLIAPDGYIYIHGAYHGYDDGTTNDPTQRFVSRLYGLNVGVREHGRTRLKVYPNPATSEVTVELEQLPVGGELRLRDALGRVVLHQRVASKQHRVPLHGLPGGVYVVEVTGNATVLATEKLIVQP